MTTKFDNAFLFVTERRQARVFLLSRPNTSCITETLCAVSVWSKSLPITGQWTIY